MNPLFALPRRSPTLLDLPDELLSRIFDTIPSACAFNQHDAWRAASALGGTCTRIRVLFRRSVPHLVLRPEDSSFTPQDVHALLTTSLPDVRAVEIARPWSRIAEPVELLTSQDTPRLTELRLCQLTSRSNLHPDELVKALRGLGPRLRVLEVSVSIMSPAGSVCIVETDD